MALSGLDIFKLLPKTNCGDCGVPTCMAFAMKLAQKKAELSECPHASDEAIATLGAASEPPIRLVKIGKDSPLEVGNETVMFRHEKTFFHQTGIAIQLRTSEGEDKIRQKIREIEEYKVERVGEELETDLFLISHDTPDKEIFLKTIQLVEENSKKGIILDCAEYETMKAGASLLKENRAALLLNNTVTDEWIDLAKNNKCCLILTSNSYEDLAAQVEKTKQAGIQDILLNITSNDTGSQIQQNTILRRSALKKNYKPFGYPLFHNMDAETEFDMCATATAMLCKYGSIIALPEYNRALLYALLTLRQNIYTDPQKPIQVDPKVYPIGEPTPESPVFVTTNFSLTYFIVSGEIENSGISAHLVVCDTEGQSVLTAWAAGKFVGETIAKFIKDIGLEQQVKTRKIVIPGFISQISGDLEENLPGWETIVGCQEASDIPSFVKNVELI
jgi:acetyl-CoA decarbonylase/synthase complex subunit gamma